jgi:hypothetical protein
MRSKNCGADEPLFRHYSTVCPDKSALQKLMIMSSNIADFPGLQATNSTRAERDIYSIVRTVVPYHMQKIETLTEGGGLWREEVGQTMSIHRYTPQSLPIHSPVAAQQISLWLLAHGCDTVSALDAATGCPRRPSWKTTVTAIKLLELKRKPAAARRRVSSGTC